MFYFNNKKLNVYIPDVLNKEYAEDYIQKLINFSEVFMPNINSDKLVIFIEKALASVRYVI